MTTEELIDSYSDLLITQYAALPNAEGTIRAYVTEVVQNQVYEAVRDGFNFAVTPIGLQADSAAGAQLDAVASYRGAQREIFGLDLSRAYMQMPFYGQSDADTVPGFAVYGQSPITWFFLSYSDANRPIYALRDDELYRLTQFLARSQGMLLSVENVDDLLFDFFGDNVGVRESGTMAITYIDLISDPDTLFGILNATNSLPRPAGVKATVIRSETLTGFFGLQIYGEALNPDFVGFGLYGSPQAGSFVRYP